MTLSLALWVADAAEEGKKTIVSMLVVGLIFVAVIVCGFLFDWLMDVWAWSTLGPSANLHSFMTLAATGIPFDVAHASGAIVKVIFENHYLTPDEIVRACQATEAAGADFVKTSTGFAAGGATHEDLALMRRSVSPHVGVKAAGGVRTLDALIDVMNLGVTRIGATATKAIIDDFRARKRGEVAVASPAGAATEGSS